MTRAIRCCIRSAIFSCACGAIFGCGSTGSAGTTASAGGASTAAGPGDSGQLVGSFQLKLTPASAEITASSALVGKVYDGPTPSAIVWGDPQVDGRCTLTTPRVPFCSTACGGSSVCAEDDTCQAYPTARGVGAVTVTGVKTAGGDSSFVMSPIANTYQPPSGVSLAYPPFGDGDALTLSASGDYYPAFTLTGQGVAPLALSSASITLQNGKPLTLTWVPSAEKHSKIHVKLDISHHGGSKGQIECDGEDNGELILSASLLSKLLDLGVAGYPTVIVSRHAVGSAVISAGRVELDVSSVVEQAVSVEGLMSCTDDTDCVDGTTCQTDLTCS